MDKLCHCRVQQSHWMEQCILVRVTTSSMLSMVTLLKGSGLQPASCVQKIRARVPTSVLSHPISLKWRTPFRYQAMVGRNVRVERVDISVHATVKDGAI
jgi:hypothetical protein